MKSILTKFSLLSAALVASLWAGDTTIILQNGLNGYNGCEDASLFNHYYDTSFAEINYGEDSSLNILYGKIDSGQTIDKNR